MAYDNEKSHLAPCTYLKGKLQPDSMNCDQAFWSVGFSLWFGVHSVCAMWSSNQCTQVQLSPDTQDASLWLFWTSCNQFKSPKKHNLTRLEFRQCILISGCLHLLPDLGTAPKSPISDWHHLKTCHDRRKKKNLLCIMQRHPTQRIWKLDTSKTSTTSWQLGHTQVEKYST